MAENIGRPRVSVALCTHNGATFVGEQLTSILQQTLSVSEIVLSDDASTDDTVSIVEGMVASSSAPRPALRVIRNVQALGVLANFEQATKACSGDLIALCDQDDVWHPEKLALIVGAFAAHPELALVHTDASLVDAAGVRLPGALLASLDATRQELNEIHSGNGYRTLLRRNLVTGATTIFRASLVEIATPFPLHWVHDEWLAILAAAIARIDVIERELIDYRQHGSNQIGARRLTVRQKFGRLAEPRSERNRRLVARAVELYERLVALRAEPVVVALAKGKLEHEQFRASLPASRMRRVGPVFGAWVGGRYAHFSRGLIDVARDLLQPPD
jgi:glycosyltransferase involved in cell wall biosynthesis